MCPYSLTHFLLLLTIQETESKPNKKKKTMSMKDDAIVYSTRRVEWMIRIVDILLSFGFTFDLTKLRLIGA